MKRLIIFLVAISLLTPVVVQAAAVAPVATTQRQAGSIFGDWTVTWPGITTTNNTATAYDASDKFAAMTVQATGTWGGGTIALFGSNDGTTWFALTAVETSAAISMTADGFKTIIQAPVRQVKWTLAGGDGTTNLKVIVKGQR